jgi:phosphomannomutase
VVDIGEIATPVMYYATHTQGIDCGLMVTESHNPADYNGIKMVLAGKTLTQENIDILYNLVVAGKRIYANLWGQNLWGQALKCEFTGFLLEMYW